MNIEIKNNLRLTHLPPGLRDILMDKLKFQNPKWVENNRMGRWNQGVPKELKFYDKIKGGGLWIPRGYIRQLIYLCKNQNIQYYIDDKRRLLPEIEYVFLGKLKSFQENAATAMLAKDFGILCAPTGSGKTVITLYMIAMRKQPALIVVHTKELAFQWIKRIETFLAIPSDDVGFIGGGKKNMGEKITVALVQTLYKFAEEVSDQVGFLVVDESHRCPSRTFSEAVASFDSKFMLGLSATPYRRDKLSRLIFWHLGDMHHNVNKQHLVEKGHILKAKVIVRETEFKPYYDPVNFYSKMLSELTADKERNHLIASDIEKEVQENTGICLVLSDRKAHCENLRAILKYSHKVEAELLTGDIQSAERQNILERLNKGEIKVLVATGQLIGEGFDCKNLSTLFLATPIKFSGRVLQYIGRILRPAPGKHQAKIFDYVDVKVDVLKAAAQNRQRAYRE